MDKASTKLRRGSSAFSNINNNPPHNNLFAFAVLSRGDLRLSEKSKKVKLRSLSAAGTASSMGCDVSDQQTHAIATTKRFRLHNNFLIDCNGASVPRKLRSATKKRGRESMLLDSEKVKKHKMDGIESLKKDSVKKSKVSVKQRISHDWSPREGASGPITKDEEEVAETLYALAGMFQDNGSNHNSTDLDHKSLPDKTSVLQDLEDDATAALQASAIAPGESSAAEASKISCLNEAVDKKQPHLPTLLMPSHSTSLTINLHTMPVVAVKRENSSEVAFHDSELCLAMGFNMTRQSLISQVERKPEVPFEVASDIDCKQPQHLIKGQKGNGLSPLAPASQAYLQSSATKAHDWMKTAIHASKLDSMEASTCFSSERIFIPKTKRYWKRCAAHVHISHIIKSLEVPKTQVIKGTELFKCDLMRAHEGSKRGVLLEVHSLNGTRNGITSSTVKNPHESKNIILQQQCHYRGITQAAPTPVVYGHQKQNFNFLSLSAGSNELKFDNNYNKLGSRLEPLSKFQVPYLHSLAQQHGVIPIPAAHSPYASTSYLDQLSVAGPRVRLQQPHYFGNPLYGTNYSSTVSRKQEHQSFWGLQQAEQGRSTVNFNILRTQYPNWQSGMYDSAASQEIFGSTITLISGQQK